jgi:hypothetical protein
MVYFAAFLISEAKACSVRISGEAGVAWSNYCPGICPEWLQKPWNPSIRTGYVTTLIRNKRLPNISPEHYWYTVLLSVCSVLFRMYQYYVQAQMFMKNESIFFRYAYMIMKLREEYTADTGYY